jgi:D-alanyl-D-alanine carboxypeptidase
MKKLLIPLLLITILALTLAACGAPAVSPATPTEPAKATEPAKEEAAQLPATGEVDELPEATVAALDDFLQQLTYTEGAEPESAAPGLVLLVDTPAGRYLKAAGVANMDDQTPMKEDDILEIGSNTKSFTIVLLMQLQEEGILSLDDPLSKWLPDWAEKIPNGDQMTLRQLAYHISGIWDYGDPILDASATDPDFMTKHFTPEDLVQYALDNGTPLFKPGEEGKWSYSNTGYVLLGMVIEKAAGKSLGEQYQERIFDPLNMKTAVLIEDVPQEGEITTKGYHFTKDGKIIDATNWNLSQAWAAGALTMTAEDLLIYAKALSAGELFQNPDSLQEMLTFDPNGMEGKMPYGLGLLDFSTFAADGYWGHEGQTLGFQSVWATNPDTGITVIGLTNSGTFGAFSFLSVLASDSNN